MWGALSDERMGLLFANAAGPCQRSHSWVRVPWDSLQYFTLSDSRLPTSSPPTTHRATVGVLDPASTRDSVITESEFYFPTEHLAVIVLNVTSSLTGGWVCRLKLLLGLAIAVIPQVPVPRDSWPHFTVSESESELLYDWRFTPNQFALAPSPLRLTDRTFSIYHLRW
jgi:hypothetical protein